jgi:hypothetical protein
VADRHAFLLRIDPELHDVLQRWAADDLRSLNGQLEFLLRRAAQQAGRLPGPASEKTTAKAPRREENQHD